MTIWRARFGHDVTSEPASGGLFTVGFGDRLNFCSTTSGFSDIHVGRRGLITCKSNVNRVMFGGFHLFGRYKAIFCEDRERSENKSNATSLRQLLMILQSCSSNRNGRQDIKFLTTFSPASHQPGILPRLDRV